MPKKETDPALLLAYLSLKTAITKAVARVRFKQGRPYLQYVKKQMRELRKRCAAL
jgi:hypothetical protein